MTTIINIIGAICYGASLFMLLILVPVLVVMLMKGA